MIDVNTLPACPVETTLTLISDKWKILIVRDLLTCLLYTSDAADD